MTANNQNRNQEKAIIFKTTTVLPLENTATVPQQQYQEGNTQNHKGIYKTTKSAALEEDNH